MPTEAILVLVSVLGTGLVSLLVQVVTLRLAEKRDVEKERRQRGAEYNQRMLEPVQEVLRKAAERLNRRITEKAVLGVITDPKKKEMLTSWQSKREAEDFNKAFDEGLPVIASVLDDELREMLAKILFMQSDDSPRGVQVREAHEKIKKLITEGY